MNNVLQFPSLFERVLREQRKKTPEEMEIEDKKLFDALLAGLECNQYEYDPKEEY